MPILSLAAWLLLSLTLASAALAETELQVEVVVRKAAVLEQVAAPDVQVNGPVEPIGEREVQLVDPAGSDPLEEPLTCLARTIYWEAKGVPGLDMESVANVVINRVASQRYPNTVCEVVTQGSEHGPCQFSWWCNGRPNEVVEDDAYQVAREVARQALNQELFDHTEGALYFHDRTVHPHWANVFLLTAETDAFLFYRPK